MASVELQSVFKSYGDLPAVIRDVSLQLADGEFCAFVGPSGCGKSTLLRLVVGLETLSDGELRIGGQRMNEQAPAKRGVAMVFQSYALFPHMTVYQNLALGLSLARVEKSVIDGKVRQAARALQLDTLLDRKPKSLSGGQRQRVAIGRAIVREPGVFLFDEPLSNLDASLRVQTRFEIACLHREYGRASTIYVTHDQVEAMTLADRILLLYHRPCNLFVAGFIGSPKMNFLDGKFALPYKAHTIGVRSEHLEFVAKGGWAGKVIHSETLGSDSFVFVDVGSSEPIIVRETGTTIYSVDAKVSVAPLKGRVHLFNAQGRAI